MSCPHSTTCPLFPRLRGGLGAWRAAFCDDDASWGKCERYKLSLTGKPVPLALLPTGKLVGTIVEEETRAAADRRELLDSLVRTASDPEPEFEVATEREMAATRRSLLARIFRRRPSSKDATELVGS